MACDVAMPRVRSGHRRSPVYWWNEEIAELRACCIRHRRRATRIRGYAPVDAQRLLDREVKASRKLLRMAICKAKVRAWNDLHWMLIHGAGPIELYLSVFDAWALLYPRCSILQRLKKLLGLFPEDEVEPRELIPFE